MFLTSLVDPSNYTTCKSLNNQNCETHPTLINLHPNEFRQELHYNLFAVKLDRYIESCKTHNDWSNKVCVPNKMKDLNINKVNMTARIRESNTQIQM